MDRLLEYFGKHLLLASFALVAAIAVLVNIGAVRGTRGPSIDQHLKSH